MDDQAGAENAEENEAIEREEIEAIQGDETEPIDSLQIEPMYPEQTEAMDSLEIERFAEIEANADEEQAIIARVDRQLVITSELPQPEEKKNKRKKPMADAENIPARITRSKVVNPANNTRSKKKI